jgi:hypothetical protein
MANTSLAVYYRAQSDLRRARGLTAQDAKKKVDNSTSKARDIFEYLVCQFYVKKAREYVEHNPSATPLDYTAPFGHEDLRALCVSVFQAIRRSVSQLMRIMADSQASHDCV